MRILNKTEKEICKRILRGSGSNNFLGNIIDNELSGVCIFVDPKNSKSHLIFTVNDTNNVTSEEFQNLNERTESITFYILQVVNLIKLLESEGYILLIERGVNSKEASKFGRCISNLPSIDHYFVDENIIKLLCEYSNKEIYATEEFERFCKNKFIARDEQRFRKQIGFTQAALAVAILALLFNIIVNSCLNKTKEVKIEQKQFNEIINTKKNGIR